MIYKRQTPRHRVFVSFHHEEDQAYKDYFVRMMGDDFVDESVEDGDIDDNLKVETIRQKIRDDFIRDATVTVALIGRSTWQRKHVDWEIGSSIRQTKLNSRCGLLGILLPTHWDYNTGHYTPRLVPPRLYDNCKGNNPYSSIYNWSSDADEVREWIHRAFLRRDTVQPINSRPQYKNNRGGSNSRGWSG